MGEQLEFDLLDIESMGPDFDVTGSYSTIIPAFLHMENPLYWKAYYKSVGIDVSKYTNLNQLESDLSNIYYKFTEDVKTNPNKFKKYLGALYKATTINENAKSLWDTYGKYDDNTKEFTVNESQKQNFADWYNKARTDGKFGYFHLTPPLKQKSKEKTVIISPEEDPTPSGGSDPKEKLKLDDENPYDIIPLIEQPEERKDIKPWLTPIIAGHTNDWLTAGRVANEKKKGITVAKETAPYKHAIVTNDYFTRSQMEKSAKEAEQLAAQPVFGDAKAQAEYRDKYLKYADDIRAKALALKQETFNKTSKEVNDAINWNRAVEIDTDNKNKAKIAAAKLLLANINAQEALSKGTTQSKFITDTANEIRQAEYINKLDKQTRIKQEAINTIQDQIDVLQEEYKSVYKLDICDDENFVSRFNALAQDDKYSTDSELMAAGDDQDKIKEFFESKRDLDPTIKAIYNDFDKQKSEALLVILKEINNLKRKQNIKSSELIYVSNTPESVENAYHFLKSLRLKSGGNIETAKIRAELDRFNAILRSQDRFRERLYKQQRDANKSTTERLKIAQNNLDKALGRLSQEDMLLLKKLFS